MESEQKHRQSAWWTLSHNRRPAIPGFSRNRATAFRIWTAPEGILHLVKKNDYALL